MTDDRHGWPGGSAGYETARVIVAFRAARGRLATDPEMAGRIAALTARTGRAVEQAPPAVHDLDRALGILSSLIQARDVARTLAARLPQLSGNSLDGGFRRDFPGMRDGFRSLARELDLRIGHSQNIVDVLGDSLDSAFAGTSNADELTRARATREAARQVRLIRTSARGPAFELASAATSDHAEAMCLELDISRYSNSSIEADQGIREDAQDLAKILDHVRCMTIELAVSTANGDLSGRDLGDLDVSGADLTQVNLAGALLDGVWWSETTRWPPGEERWIRARSRPVGAGIYEVTGPDPGRGWRSGSLQA
jgi:hypothetical protein